MTFIDRALSFVEDQIKRHWLLVALVLLLLWLLPKLINALALLVSQARAAVSDVLGVTTSAGQAADALLAKAQDALAESPGVIATAITALVTIIAPPLGAILWAWRALDLFKGEERLEYSRTKKIQTPSGPQPDERPFEDPFNLPFGFGL